MTSSRPHTFVAVLLAASMCAVGCQEREPQAVHRTTVDVPVHTLYQVRYTVGQADMIETRRG